MAYLYDYNAKFGDKVIHAADKLLVTYNVGYTNNSSNLVSEMNNLSIDVYEDAPVGGSLNKITRIYPRGGTTNSGVTYYVGSTAPSNMVVYDDRYLIVDYAQFRTYSNGLLNGGIFVYDLNELAQYQYTIDGKEYTYPKVAIYNPDGGASASSAWTLGGLKLISENGVEKLATKRDTRDGSQSELHIVDIQEMLSLPTSAYGDGNVFSYRDLNNTIIIPLPSGGFGLSDGLYHTSSTETDRVTMQIVDQKIVFEYNTSTNSWETSPSTTVELISEGYTDGSDNVDLIVSDDVTIREGISGSVTIFNEHKRAFRLAGDAGQYPSANNSTTKHMDPEFDISSAVTPVSVVGQNPIPDISLVSGPPNNLGKFAGVYWNFYPDGTWRVWTFASTTERVDYYGNWLSGPMPYGVTYSIACHASEINGSPFSLTQTNGDGRFILEGDNENALVPGVTLAGSGVRPSYMSGWNHVSQSEVAAGHLKFTETDPALNQDYSGYAIITFSVNGEAPSMLPSENSFRFDYTLADSV
jgi:hypothetical protein